MATVKVQRVKGYDPFSKKDMYYVRTKSTGVMSTQDIVENIVREGQIPRIYAQGVLDYLTQAMFDYMKAGLSVQVPGLGTFKLNVTSKAQTDEKKATASTITGVKLQLIPLESVKQEMANFRFEMVEDKTVEDSGNGSNEDEVPTNPGNNPGNGNGTTGSGTEGEDNYRVTYLFHDNTVEEQEYKAGQTIVPPTNTAGYVWKDLPATMPAQDITVTEEEDPNMPPAGSGGSGFE